MLRKRPIHKIACGAYHSLAIDDEGALSSRVKQFRSNSTRPKNQIASPNKAKY